MDVITIKFEGRTSYCILKYSSCSSYYVSVFSQINGVQLMEFCSDGGKIRFSVPSREDADRVSKELMSAIDDFQDAVIKVESIGL